MQRQLNYSIHCEEEEIKKAGLTLDFDEMAKKSSMSKEEGLISKWYGIYGSRQAGDYMMRVVIPGGKLTTTQALSIAQISRKYSKSLISVTTRQAIQFHFLKLHNLADVLRDVKAAHLTSFHGCGDVTRTMAACPLADDCQYRRINVRPYASAAMKKLSDSRDLDNLPRKFKVTWSGCPANCAQPFINCVGVTAVQCKIGNDNKLGFSVVIGGGMGWKPYVAQELFSFVPQELIISVVRAIALFYRDHGDRTNRQKSRLKFVVEKYGIDKCRELIIDILRKENVETSSLISTPLAETGIQFPSRPLTDTNVAKTQNNCIRVIIPKGELTADNFEKLASLAEMYGDHQLYTNNRQNIEIHGVNEKFTNTVITEIEKLGLSISGNYGLSDIVTCVGTTYCPKAVSTTRNLYDILMPIVKDKKYESIQDFAFINITGCPNSCSPYRISDIGFRGMRIREESGSVEAYEVLVGGDQKSFGHKIGEFKVDDCVDITKKILNTFLKIRTADETLNASISRIGIEQFIRELNFTKDYTKAPLVSPYPDSFVTTTEALNTIARDIPCQDACPAQTNVPEYIQELINTSPDKSYEINVECNVFPGVLGRVCTRPCETKCRHQWTNVNGPVTICHLKRAASDYKQNIKVPQPLFPSTNKRVAIIGGGPSGLTAARELSRFGHDVTIYEKEDHLGGMMVDGIPRFRLPIDIVKREIDQIISMGIKVELNTAISSEKIEEFTNAYDAVLVAAGTMIPNTLDIENIQQAKTISGLHFMRDYNRGDLKQLEGDVVIIGGGFTAVDCARSCARAVRRITDKNYNVTIAYRRSEQFMAASYDEQIDIMDEYIKIITMINPIKINVDKDNTISSVTFRRNALLKSNSNEKPAITEIPNSEFEIPCNHVIIAIGQTQEWSLLPQGTQFTKGFATNNPKIFVTGDFLTGSDNIIKAVAQGRKSAELIDLKIIGRSRFQKGVLATVIDNDGRSGRVRDNDLRCPIPMTIESPQTRLQSDNEFELGFTESEYVDNAKRCYLCHYKFEIDQDRCIHCNWCIDAAPRKCIHKVVNFQDNDQTKPVIASSEDQATFIWIDSNECIRCGKCLRACPTQAIRMIKTTILRKTE